MGRRIAAIIRAVPAVGFRPVHAGASAARPLQAGQLRTRQLLEKHGATGTFYINSALIGLPGYMTRANLDAPRAAGQEYRQICQDHHARMSWRHSVTSFARPFVEFDSTTRVTAQRCGTQNPASNGHATGTWTSPTVAAGSGRTLDHAGRKSTDEYRMVDN
jgi:hypothetical protein